jgi:GNAT superfamily N-acetyltransferase
MTERSTVRFSDEAIIPQFEQTIQVYKDAFAGYPWFEDLTAEQVQRRIENDLSRPGFEGVWFIDENLDLLGASWYYDINLDQIKAERGEALATFAQTTINEHGINHVVWHSMTAVAPKYQRLGIGREIKKVVFQDLQTVADSSGPILYLTRIRGDNFGSQGMNREFLSTTGIKIAASKTNPNQPDGIMHEYWYRIIEPQTNG